MMRSGEDMIPRPLHDSCWSVSTSLVTWLYMRPLLNLARSLGVRNKTLRNTSWMSTPRTRMPAQQSPAFAVTDVACKHE